MADPTLFAAPDAAAHGSTAGGALEVTLALLVVVGFIAVLAWMARRSRRFGGTDGNRIQVLSEKAFGVKERCVLVRVGDTDILLGVTQNSISPLHVFPTGANTEAPPAPPATAPKLPNFKDLLMRSLGK
jgi:flagellar protein FliO/FliZ